MITESRKVGKLRKGFGSTSIPFLTSSIVPACFQNGDEIRVWRVFPYKAMTPITHRSTQITKLSRLLSRSFFIWASNNEKSEIVLPVSFWERCFVVWINNKRKASPLSRIRAPWMYMKWSTLPGIMGSFSMWWHLEKATTDLDLVKIFRINRTIKTKLINHPKFISKKANWLFMDFSWLSWLRVRVRILSPIYIIWVLVGKSISIAVSFEHPTYLCTFSRYLYCVSLTNTTTFANILLAPYLQKETSILCVFALRSALSWPPLDLSNIYFTFWNSLTM